MKKTYQLDFHIMKGFYLNETKERHKTNYWFIICSSITKKEFKKFHKYVDKKYNGQWNDIVTVNGIRESYKEFEVIREHKKLKNK